MITLDEILLKIKDYEDINKIKKAYNYASEIYKNEKRLNGDDLISHALYVANILIDLSVDADTIIAAILHEVLEFNSNNCKELEDMFGIEISNIVLNVSKINKLELSDEDDSSVKYLRKILVGMAEDVRVLYIKLADRLHNMRTNYVIKPENQKKKAKETLEILVPIAHRLGINSIKSELETLSLKYLKPEIYQDILDKLNVSVDELQGDLNLMNENIAYLLKEANINFEIKGRVKSIYSIYNKLSNGKKWSDIYDILALRIFVDKESDCYTVLGLIHSKYRSLPKRFKDYVANPKANMYQSLHTTVFGENSKLFEIQIRTYEMDLVAEKGVAAHVSYKEKGSKKAHSVMEQKLEMFRNIIESEDDDIDIKDFEINFVTDLIYVYTPKGDVVELPKGSSPIDFAYRIHSKVGDTTVGAIVNDVMVPFTYELEDGDIVSIKTCSTAKPNKDWLNIVKTSQAKNKIKSFFSKKLKDEYIERGKNILEKEARKRKLAFSEIINNDNLKIIFDTLKFNDLDEIYLSIGSLRHTAGYIINMVTKKANDADVYDVLFDKEQRKSRETKSYKGDIFVDGEKNILINIAKCCLPIKGDKIVGYITKTKGITVHKKDCSNINSNSDKLIKVEWNYDNEVLYFVTFLIEVSNDFDILPNLIELSSKNNIKIQSFENIDSSKFRVSIKTKSTEECDEYLNLVKSLQYVKNVERK